MKHQKLFNQTIEDMADSLMAHAEFEEKDLSGLTTDNFNTFLDDLFEDGGETRCERFADLAWEYSLRFGTLESLGQSNAQWKCIEAAILEIQKRLANNSNT